MMIIHLLVVGIIMYYIMKWINNKFPEPPENSDAQFLAMCCRRLNTNINEVFRIASRHYGLELTEKSLLKDVRVFLHGESDLPHYVRKFIDEGRKEGY